MINRKKTIKVAGVVFLLLLVSVSVFGLAFYSWLRKESSVLQKSLIESRLQREKEILLQIQDELSKQSSFQDVLYRIKNRVELIDKTLLNPYQTTAKNSDRGTELGQLTEQISFLISLANDLKDENNLKERINRKVAGLRGTLAVSWFVLYSDSATEKMEDLPKWLYLCKGSMKPKVRFYPDGGAVMYTIKGSFPFKKQHEDISGYYSTMAMKPLDYDLCQPSPTFSLGG